MEAFTNTGGNIFGIIPLNQMRVYVSRTQDPVKEGAEFGRILFSISNGKAKGGSADKYYMAIDYMEVMMSKYASESSVTTDPKWEQFFGAALKEFGNKSHTTHCPIKRIKALIEEHNNPTSSRPASPFSVHSRSSSKGSTNRTNSTGTEDFIAKAKAKNNVKKSFPKQIVSMWNQTIRRDRHVASAH